MLADLEYWYQEVESLLENIRLEQNEKIPLELPLPLKFEIDGPKDVESIVYLRNYFNNRINKRRELLNKVVSNGNNFALN